MDRGERERWGRLSDRAKAMLKVMASFLDDDHVHLNDLRMNAGTRGLSSREMLSAWRELASRAYGTITGADDPDPVFVINAAAVKQLLTTHRLTNQAPNT